MRVTRIRTGLEQRPVERNVIALERGVERGHPFGPRVEVEPVLDEYPEGAGGLAEGRREGVQDAVDQQGAVLALPGLDVESQLEDPLRGGRVVGAQGVRPERGGVSRRDLAKARAELLEQRHLLRVLAGEGEQQRPGQVVEQGGGHALRGLEDRLDPLRLAPTRRALESDSERGGRLRESGVQLEHDGHALVVYEVPQVVLAPPQRDDGLERGAVLDEPSRQRGLARAQGRGKDVRVRELDGR